MNEVPIKIPADAVAYKGHHYKYVDDKSTWYIARAKCEKMGGHLICIGDADEDFFAVNLIKQAQGITAWIGASDEEEAGVWRWVNGEPFSYSRWGPGQPDNTNGVETCVEITGFWKDSPWNDGVEGCRFPFVCEWDQ
jgi:Lectin C-type domain